jgi:hypothetical protein
LSFIDLFKAPRIVDATLVNDPIAIRNGRTAVRVRVEGAGVLIVGRERVRFWNGFDGVVMAPVALSVIIHARSLFHKAQRELRASPLPPLPDKIEVPVRVPVRVPALPAVSLRRFRISVNTRGTDA